MPRKRQTSLSISPSQIAANATEKVFARGEDLFHDGAVLSIARRGEALHAQVEGSEEEPYSVKVTLRDGAVESADCTCPYEYGGWCKHIVAALLFAIEAPEEIEVQMPLDELLQAMPPESLIKVLCTMAGDDPHFEEDLRVYLSGSKPRKRRDEWDDWDD